MLMDDISSYDTSRSLDSFYTSMLLVHSFAWRFSFVFYSCFIASIFGAFRLGVWIRVWGLQKTHQLFSGSSAIRSSIDCSSLRLLKCFQLTLVYCCGQGRIGSAGSNLPIESSTISPQFIMCFDRKPNICLRVRKDEDTVGQSGVFPALWSSTILFRRTWQVGVLFCHR
jgi:hypothetical protein